MRAGWAGVQAGWAGVQAGWAGVQAGWAGVRAGWAGVRAGWAGVRAGWARVRAGWSFVELRKGRAGSRCDTLMPWSIERNGVEDAFDTPGRVVGLTSWCQR